MARVTQYRTDPDLAETLVDSSLDTLIWMRDKGVRFVPIYGRQAFKVDGKFKFWGGLTVETCGGGPGPRGIADRRRAEQRRHRRSSTRRRAIELLVMTTAIVRRAGAAATAWSATSTAESVVLACGGFEANPEWRTRYLGPGWDLAKVRGTRFNTGDGIQHGARHRRASPTATGRAATRSAGTATRRSSATSRSATTSRSTAIRSASWSTPTASASSTKAPTSATTPTRNTAG